MVWSSRSYPQNHHFRGLDQRRRALSGLQPHLLSGIRCDDRGDLLFADLQPHLRKQAAVLHIHNTAKQLIPTTNLPKITAPRLNISAFQLFGKQAVDLALRNPVVSARSLGRLKLPAINPLLQRWITDAQNVSRFARRQKLLQGAPSTRYNSP